MKICSPKVIFLGSLDTGISFKDPKLVYRKSFEMTRQQTYMDEVSMLDGWEYFYPLRCSTLVVRLDNYLWGLGATYDIGQLLESFDFAM